MSKSMCFSMDKRIEKAKMVLMAGICLFIFSSCNHQRTDSSIQNEAKLFYIHSDGLSLVEKTYAMEGKDISEQAEEVLSALYEGPKIDEAKAVLDSQVVVDDFEVQDEVLKLYFSSTYNSMDSAEEILVRTAIVKSMCYIPGVKSVEFFIAGAPLLTSQQVPVGPLQPEDFIEDLAGRESQREIELTLYFADQSGRKLVKKKITTEIKGNTIISRAIIESLMEYSLADEDAFRSIPDNTRLLDVYVQDNVCYVDFSEDFIQGLPGVSPEVTVFSVVNSITEQENISKVQFLIGGRLLKEFMGLQGFDQLFENNILLLDETE